MGRGSGCCSENNEKKVGTIKKGPWTPEEDVILLSFIQQHGPGNWRAIPANTGLLRCSKSCRLRWTNYLRPGIKRGNFTPHEEGMIIHLQALLGNKWAAIASYLPQRTDNDIKNYWNTHLKNKFKRLDQTPLTTTPPPQLPSQYEYEYESESQGGYHYPNHFVTNTSNSKAKHVSDQNSNVYASSAENISRLLEGWKKRSSANNSSAGTDVEVTNTNNNHGDNTTDALIEPILSYYEENHVNNLDWEYTYTNTTTTQSQDNQESTTAEENIQDQINANYPPLSFLTETWLSYENEIMGQAQAEGSDIGTSLYFLSQ